jgi:hypothetical protein
MPGSLLSMFGGGIAEQCGRLLVLLSPLTTGSLAPLQSRIAMAN